MLLWSDGVDRYGASADLALNYTVSGTPTFLASGGAFGGGAFRCGEGLPAKSARVIFPTASTLTSGGTVHWAGWVKFTTNSSNTPTGLVCFNTNVQNASGLEPSVSVKSNSLDLQVNSHGVGESTALASSVTGVIVSGTFFHLEISAKFHTSTGFFKVWINGNLVINFSGATCSGTIPSTWIGVGQGRLANGSATVDYDDIVVWDETGSDFTQTQMCSAYLHKIETLSVNANDSVQFTPSTGSNYQNVDDPAFHNADTDYNSSSTVGHQDTFAMTAQGSTPVVTFALAVHTVAKIDIAGIVNLRTLLKSGGTTQASADRALTTTYVGFFDGYGKDPNTSSAWGNSQVNSVKPGYKYQS